MNPLKSAKEYINFLMKGGKEYYTREPDPVATVNPAKITDALWELESSSGASYPPSTNRSYTIPAANGNEQPRKVNYNSGYGTQFGLTPIGLGDIAKSTIDKNGVPTKHGYPVIPGMSPKDIQKALSTGTTTAGELARKIFMMNKASSTDMTPETLTNDYMNTYVTNASPNYNKANFDRTRKVFDKLAQSQ